MTNGAKVFQKQRQERAAEIEKLTREIETMKAQRQQIETEINTAIDAGDTVQAEKLVKQQREIDVRIEVMQRTIDRKTAQNADISELAKASNAEMADYQKKIDQATAAADNAKKAYLSKLIDVAIMVNEAWTNRAAYCSMIDGVEDPYTHNAQTTAFDGVSCRLVWDQRDSEMLKEINPEALRILGNATSSHTNLYAGREYRPKNPDVTISKYQHC